MKNFILVLLTLTFSFAAQAQETFKPIKIVDEQVNNRLNIFALNNTLKDYDVAISVKGTGFRQPTGVPRKVRVPGRSKVMLISLVVERNKTPFYTYELDISDSLSRRVLKKEYELIKITPKNPITIVITEKCASCDSLISQLDKSPFNYKVQKLVEEERMKTQLTPFIKSIGYDPDTMETPVIFIGGKMYVDIDTYPALYAKLEE